MLFRDRIKTIQWLRSLAINLRILRSRFSYISGKGNIIVKNGIQSSSKVQVLGNNNNLLFEYSCVLQNAHIHINGCNNKLVIKKGAYLEGTQIFVEDNNCVIVIGENTFIGLSHLAVTEDNSSLIIGDDCMISSHVQIRTGDSHSILDSEGNRINKAKSISISDNVWLGEGCRILKGVTLGKEVVVSTGTIVTKTFGDNVLLGGIPAKILKENITWNHQRI